MIRRGALALALLTMVMSTDASAGWKKPPKKHKEPPHHGKHENGDNQNGQVGAPEIDPSLLAGGALLIVGGTLVLMGRKRTSPS